MLRSFFGLIFILICVSLISLDQSQASAPFCQKSTDPIKCNSSDNQTRASQNACELEWKANSCEELVAKNPGLKTAGKLRNCNETSTCANPLGMKEHFSLCALQMKEAWKDAAVGIYDFFSGEASVPSDSELAKIDFFRACTSVECKRKMLGPFVSYFSKEEIEGHPDRQDLNSEDPANQTYLQGYSASVLYRKLLVRLKKESVSKSMNEKFIEPWSGKEAHLPSSMNDLIDKALESAGLKNTACFKPEVVTEMRCYALFSIIDPLLAAGAAGKILEIAGMIGKQTGKIAKAAEAISTTEKEIPLSSAKVNPEPIAKVPVEKLDNNQQINIWKIRESGDSKTADLMEDRLLKSLESSPIKTSKFAGEGVSGAHYVELENGAKGVWKPSNTTAADVAAEKAAYKIDRHLGLNNVPATIDKKMGDRDGSFQYLINDAKQSKIDDPEHFIFYDYLILNGDRHAGNYLIKEGRSVGIDHGIAFKYSTGVADFPKYVDAIIDRQRTLEKNVSAKKAELEKIKNRGDSTKAQQLETEIRNAEKKLRSEKVKAAQEVGALGITQEAALKLEKTSQSEWKEILKDLPAQEQREFLMRKQNALKAIKKAQEYFGNGIYPAGRSSPLLRRPTPIKNGTL